MEVANQNLTTGGAKCKEGASVAVLKEMPNMGSITTLS